ncbi:hypothetical protein D0466_06625 [Peribacillus glennii]|uniref:Uncharacterized protein n=1 Tax=Peribacillus glennii TaxID=2303991 RepID=A0A372LHJ3_9BACI|nr:hypothetical protein D0466_06625 [Peribacillus glennii]
MYFLILFFIKKFKLLNEKKQKIEIIHLLPLTKSPINQVRLPVYYDALYAAQEETVSSNAYI